MRNELQRVQIAEIILMEMAVVLDIVANYTAACTDFSQIKLKKKGNLLT